MSNIKYLDLYYAAYGSNMNLEEMKKYIEKARAKNTEIEGVRYNTSEEQLTQNHSSMKM